MLIHRFFPAVAFTIILSGFTTPSGTFGKSKTNWVIEKSSTLQVSGKSNVNEFTCHIPGYYETDTIKLAEDEIGKKVQLNGYMDIDVFRFDCHNTIITKDLRKTLKTNQYPRLQIHFRSLEHMPSSLNATQNIWGNVEINLAGVRKTFAIQYQFIKNGSSGFLLNGTKVFCFSDFKLSPPRKLGGMIQVKDEFTVAFQLKLRVVN